MEYSEDEEYQRSAVGRFYYACFGVAKEYYEKTTKKTLPTNESHKILINHFRHSNFPEEKEIGDDLRDIRRYRNNSDYHIKFRNGNLKKSKKTSEKLLKKFNELNENPLYTSF